MADLLQGNIRVMLTPLLPSTLDTLTYFIQSFHLSLLKSRHYGLNLRQQSNASSQADSMQHLDYWHRHQLLHSLSLSPGLLWLDVPAEVLLPLGARGIPYTVSFSLPSQDPLPRQLQTHKLTSLTWRQNLFEIRLSLNYSNPSPHFSPPHRAAAAGTSGSFQRRLPPQRILPWLLTISLPCAMSFSWKCKATQSF